MDVNGIETGDEFKRNIVTAIKESEVFLFSLQQLPMLRYGLLRRLMWQ